MHKKKQKTDKQKKIARYKKTHTRNKTKKQPFHLGMS